MKTYAYYNGDFCPYSEVRIPLDNRSIYFGDGVYDAMIGRGDKIFLFEEHIERLFKNAERLKIKIKESKEEIENIILLIIRKSRLEEYFVYVQASRCSEERRHAFVDIDKSALLVTVKDFRLPPINKRLKLITVPDIRYTMCDVKTLNLLPSVLASQKAESLLCDEAVFHRGESVTECAHSNISILKNGVLYTHPTDKCILPGITRKHLLSSAKALGIKCIERPFTLRELKASDEVIVSSTSKLCLLAEKIDDTSLSGEENSLGFSLITEVRREFFDFVSEF